MNINEIKLLQSRIIKTRNCPDKKQIENNNFDVLLDKEINNNQRFKISKHAINRMCTRNISFTNNQIKKINSAIDKASQKGIKESLIVIDGTSLVVNINKRVIVTAIDNQESKEKVFTNIDGAIII